jgi:predicted RNA-binding protein Jag
VSSTEWVEVAAKTIEEATREGLTALGIESIDDAEVEVVQEPKLGFLGLGGQDARVIVRSKPQQRKRRRSRGRRGKGKKPEDRQGRPDGGGKPRGEAKKAGGDGGGAQRRDRQDRQERQKRTDRGSSDRGGAGAPSGGRKQPMTDTEEREAPDREAQAAIVADFLSGLLDSLGLEGDVATRVEDDTIHVDVTGSQTEALVGNKGATMSSVLELCRTVVQRKSQANARLPPGMRLGAVRHSRSTPGASPTRCSRRAERSCSSP